MSDSLSDMQYVEGLLGTLEKSIIGVQLCFNDQLLKKLKAPNALTL